MEIPELDTVCLKLLSTFLLEELPFPFNTLYRSLNRNGFKISKPTLSLHLKHLVEKGLVIRTEIENTQYVTYHYNWEKWEKLDQIMKKTRINKKFFTERATFDSSSPKEQVFRVHRVLLLQELCQLKCELLKILEPDKAFQHTLEVELNGSMWERVKRWLLDNFIQNDAEYRTEIVCIINKLIAQYRIHVFE